MPLRSAVSTAGNDDAIGLNVHVPIDSKAMRKFTNDQAVVLIAETITGDMTSVVVNGGIAWLLGA